MRHMVGPDAHGQPPPGQAAPGRPTRSLATAYLIWFLVGIFGGHRFYLGDGRGGRRYLVALAIGVALPVLGLAIALLTRDIGGVTVGLVGWIAGLLVLLGVLAMAIADAFRLPALTRRANAEPSLPPTGSAPPTSAARQARAGRDERVSRQRAATTSISQRAPMARPATPTVARVGGSLGKYSRQTSL